MAEVRLYAGEDQYVISPSGLGFFGENGFGDPVQKNQFNARTFVCNASGTTESFECNNNQWVSTTGVIHGQSGSGILLTELPNILATANFRFLHSSIVQTQSAKLFIFDGTYDGNGDANRNNDPSGLTAYCAEIRHTDPVQGDNGFGDTTWQDIKGSSSLALISSPGTSGYRPNGSLTTDTRHDWYVAISPTPTTFGSKYFGMLFETEFL